MVTIKKIKVSALRTIDDPKERKKEKQELKKISGSPVLIILYILGMTGIAFTVLDLLDMSITGFHLIIMGVMALIVTGFWYLFTRHSRAFIIVTALLTGASALLLIPQVYRLTVRIRMMMKYNVSLDNLEIDTVFIIILVLLAIFFLFSLEFVIRNHSIMLVSGLALLILVPIFGHSMELLNMIMLIIFEAGFIVVNMAEKRSGRYVMRSPSRAKINTLSAVVAVAIVLVSLVPAFALERAGEKSLFNWAYETDSYIKDTITRLTESSFGSGFNDGSVSRGNLFQSSAEQFRITVSEIPEDTLYLKGFTGRDYENSNWSPAFYVAEGSSGTINFWEAAAADIIYDVYSTYPSDIPYSFYYLGMGATDPISEMYFMLAKDTVLNDDYFITTTDGGITYLQVNPSQEETGYFSNKNEHRIIIENINPGIADHRFVPYGAKYSFSRIRNVYKNASGSYSNSYLTPADLNASENLGKLGVFKALLSSYKNIIQTEYTRYPGDQQRLIAHCRATPLTRLEDITTYILVTLQNKATYTTTPGNTPYNKDVVDYFLFDNGQGYCVHFASAAVMMYRMYGIPARYATGFVARPAGFSANEGSATYSSTLTGKHAHAWVEIFLDDYGWVPVEVTPTLQGTMHCEYPGYDESTMRASMVRNGWSFRQQTSSEDSGTGLFGMGRAASRGFAAASFIFIFAALFCAVIALFIRRSIILSKLATMNCRRLFDRIIKLIHRAGLLKDCNGSETDFAQRLSESLDCIDISTSARLIRIMLEVNYSDKKVSRSDRDFIEDVYRMISAELYARASVIKKPIYMFIFAIPTKAAPVPKQGI